MLNIVICEHFSFQVLFTEVPKVLQKEQIQWLIRCQNNP